MDQCNDWNFKETFPLERSAKMLFDFVGGMTQVCKE